MYDVHSWGEIKWEESIQRLGEGGYKWVFVAIARTETNRKLKEKIKN